MKREKKRSLREIKTMVEGEVVQVLFCTHNSGFSQCLSNASKMLRRRKQTPFVNFPITLEDEL